MSENIIDNIIEEGRRMFENGHSRGMVKREIVKTWRAGK
jgi:hypothetical protein